MASLEVLREKKWWIFGALLLSIVLMVALVSYFSFYLGIHGFDFEGVERIEYIEYEGEPFSSAIRLKKELFLKEDPSIIQRIQGELTLSNREKVQSQSCNRMLFFYHRDGSILNAYVQGDLLGFDYGSSWIRIQELSTIIDDLTLVERIKVKEGS